LPLVAPVGRPIRLDRPPKTEVHLACLRRQRR